MNVHYCLHPRWNPVILTIALISLFLPSIHVSAPAGTAYYVDSRYGSDSNPGTSYQRPWKTLRPVNNRVFEPGDRIHLRAGSDWSGGLSIRGNGEPGKPILVTRYGDGARPIIRNSGKNSHSVDIKGSHIIVEWLLLRDAQEGGVYIHENANYNIVRNNEITAAGSGVWVRGQRNLITGNYIHNLVMIVDTPKEISDKDDYGAVGVWFCNGYNEASYNKIVNCRAHSYDYGEDGGAFEWWGDAPGNYVHHNWAENNNGFMEIGCPGKRDGTARDSVVAYNVMVNNGPLGVFHMGGGFASEVENFRIEHNTIVQVGTDDEYFSQLDFKEAPPNLSLKLRNNIFYVEDFDWIASHDGFTHERNFYYLLGGTRMDNISLHPTEMRADPLFVNLSGRDFRLQAESPAIDHGANLGYTVDYAGMPVPQGAAPDCGAYEYTRTSSQSSPQSSLP